MTSDLAIYQWFGSNNAIFVWVNGFHAPWWDWLATSVSAAGGARSFPYWVAAAAALSWWRPTFLPALNVAVFATGFVISGLVVPWLKVVVDAPRPFLALGTEAVRNLGALPDDSSFPSGHAAFAAMLAAALSPHTHWAFRSLLWSFAACVCISRIVVGHHFPADVVGGALLGIVVAALLHWAMRRVRPSVAPA